MRLTWGKSIVQVEKFLCLYRASIAPRNNFCASIDHRWRHQMNFTGQTQTDGGFLIKQYHPAVGRVVKFCCRLFDNDGDVAV